MVANNKRGKKQECFRVETHMHYYYLCHSGYVFLFFCLLHFFFISDSHMNSNQTKDCNISQVISCGKLYACSKCLVCIVCTSFGQQQWMHFITIYFPFSVHFLVIHYYFTVESEGDHKMWESASDVSVCRIFFFFLLFFWHLLGDRHVCEMNSFLF